MSRFLSLPTGVCRVLFDAKKDCAWALMTPRVLRVFNHKNKPLKRNSKESIEFQKLIEPLESNPIINPQMSPLSPDNWTGSPELYHQAYHTLS